MPRFFVIKFHHEEGQVSDTQHERGVQENPSGGQRQVPPEEHITHRRGPGKCYHGGICERLEEFCV